VTQLLTVPEKLLLGALKAREISPTFSAELLVVEAWKLFPDTFGLAGFSRSYPDSNRVLTNIMGTKGMRGKGWLRKVGEKQYRLSSSGLSEGSRLLERMQSRSDEQPAQQALRAELDRQVTHSLERVLHTPAAQRALAGDEGAITFHDACGFWDITVRSNANTLVARLSDVETLLQSALKAAEGAGDDHAIKLRFGEVTRDEILELISLHHRLQKRFETELNIIRRRTDERSHKATRV
jgi:hypothetical protein